MVFDLCEQGNVLHNVNDVQGQILGVILVYDMDVNCGYTMNLFFSLGH